MAIYSPGKRARNGHTKSSAREAVAVLQLTAMVDMFTVLCVFLLQNYATTNQILPIDESVALPQAHEVRELKPSNVVVVSEEGGVVLNNVKIADLRSVKEQEDWLVKGLSEQIQKFITDGEAKKKSLGTQIRNAVNEPKTDKAEIDDFRKMTVQADKKIDFLTVKKVMYTVTEAGIQEINFAVLKKPEDAVN